MMRMTRAFILAATVAFFLPLYSNAQFPSDGGFRIGCNYWASHAGMKMWSRWDAAQVEKDLDALADNGITVLRVFPLWPDSSRLPLNTSGRERSASGRRTTARLRILLALTRK